MPTTAIQPTRSISFIEYHSPMLTANAEIARQAERAAGIPALAINHAIPGAPLYGCRQISSGRPHRRLKALGEYGHAELAGRDSSVSAMVGDLDEAGPCLAERALRHRRRFAPGASPVFAVTRLDPGGNALRIEGVLTKFLPHA